MVFEIGSFNGFLVRLDGFRETDAVIFERSGGADCVVCSVQGGGVVAVPGDVGEGADYGEDLRVGVGDGVEHFVVGCVVAICAIGR